MNGRSVNVVSCTSTDSSPSRKISSHPSEKYRAAHRSTRLELVIWLVPSLVGGAISVSFVGLMLGPIYPIAMNHAGRVFPPWLLTGSIGWIAAIATAGAAVVPFITGAIASKTGIKSLEPVYVRSSYWSDSKLMDVDLTQRRCDVGSDVGSMDGGSG
jgi:hypothetical protein